MFLFKLLGLELFYSFLSTACVFTGVFERLIHFSLKDLYHINKNYFMVFVLFFSSVAISRAYCGRFVGLH